ncbi:MAG: TIGR04076 family protein [Desulfobacca sp.]|nr:TIGR04076 family protein [Desulfobacca sp.]
MKNQKEDYKMALDPGIGQKVTATITFVKGKCSAGHQVNETFEISCHNPGGLCGFFYHDIFPTLSTFQFGGNFPWWQGDTIEVQCPDPGNLVTIRLERTKRI